MIFGTYKDGSEASCSQEGVNGCTRLDDGTWGKQGWVELPPHSNSSQVKGGMYDVDMVRAYDDQHPLNGTYDTNYEYKLADTDEVHVVSNPLNCAASAVGVSLGCPAQFVDSKPKAGAAFWDIIGAMFSNGWRRCSDHGCSAPYE
jgi:hypothetical protein